MKIRFVEFVVVRMIVSQDVQSVLEIQNCKNLVKENGNG